MSAEIQICVKRGVSSGQGALTGGEGVKCSTTVICFFMDIFKVTEKMKNAYIMPGNFKLCA